MTPEEAYQICRSHNKRIKEYEPIILTSYLFSYLYAYAIIKGRWPEAEPIILTSMSTSLEYAKEIIKDRWPEAEMILINSFYWQDYCYHFDIKQDYSNWKTGL